MVNSCVRKDFVKRDLYESAKENDSFATAFFVLILGEKDPNEKAVWLHERIYLLCLL